MLYGIDSNRTRRRQELTNIKEVGQKEVFYRRIGRIDVFGFADQDKITYALGYNLYFKRNTNNNAIYRTAATAEGKIILKNIARFVEKFTSNPDIQKLVADQMLSKIPTEIYYEERSVFRKKIIIAGTWEMQLGIQSGKDIPSIVFIAFMKMIDSILKEMTILFLIGCPYHLLLVDWEVR